MRMHCYHETKLVFGFVVPVYRTPFQYIGKCVDSILSQTYPNIRLVLVDDASPDNCGKYCEELAKKDKRIKVVHHEKNRGLPEARNTGMDHIEADWIAFVDSDDWVEKDMCEKLLVEIEHQAADMYIFSGFRNLGEYEVACTYHFSHRKMFASKNDRERLQMQVFFDQTKSGVVNALPIQGAWNRLYCTSFLRRKNVRFTDVRFSEDAIMHMRGVEAADSVVYLCHRFYHYRDTPNSMVNSYRPNADVEQISVMNEMWRFAKEANKSNEFYKYMYIFAFMSMQMCVWQKYYNKKCKMTRSERKKACRELFSHHPYASTLENMKRLPLRELRRNQIIKYYLMKLKLYGLMVKLRTIAK